MRNHLFYFAVVSLITACMGSTSPVGAKPSVPLRIEIAPPARLESNRLGDFTITVTSLADLPHVEIVVDVPKGAAVFSGDLEWKGPMRENSRHVSVITLRIPSAGEHVIHVEAVARTGTNLLKAQKDFDLNPASKSRKTPDVSPAPKNGVIDFPLD